MPAQSKSTRKDSAANLGFEAKLWLAADKLRSNRDAAEYKHVVLCLIFLKYIADTFDEHHAKLFAGEGDFAGAHPMQSRTLATLRDTRLPKLPSGELSVTEPNL